METQTGLHQVLTHNAKNTKLGADYLNLNPLPGANLTVGRTAGLLTHPYFPRLPGYMASGKLQKISLIERLRTSSLARELQQRVLSRNLTVFPFNVRYSLTLQTRTAILTAKLQTLFLIPKNFLECIVQ